MRPRLQNDIRFWLGAYSGVATAFVLFSLGLVPPAWLGLVMWGITPIAGVAAHFALKAIQRGSPQ